VEAVLVDPAAPGLVLRPSRVDFSLQKSTKIQGTLRGYSVNDQGGFRKRSGNVQAALMSVCTVWQTCTCTKAQHSVARPITRSDKKRRRKKVHTGS
jgi:hypothetical protein